MSKKHSDCKQAHAITAIGSVTTVSVAGHETAGKFLEELNKVNEQKKECFPSSTIIVCTGASAWFRAMFKSFREVGIPKKSLSHRILSIEKFKLQESHLQQKPLSPIP